MRVSHQKYMQYSVFKTICLYVLQTWKNINESCKQGGLGCPPYAGLSLSIAGLLPLVSGRDECIA